MSIRDRLRVWLGISDIQNQAMLTVDAIPNFRKDLQRELDNTAKGHRELIDGLTNTCREFNERLDAFQTKIEADKAVLYKTAQDDLAALVKRVNANRSECAEELRLINTSAIELTGHVERIGATFWADQAKVKEDVLAHDRRLAALETGDKSFGAHLAVVVDDAVRCERNRCAKIVEKACLPFFRGSHRETLAKLIRSGK